MMKTYLGTTLFTFLITIMGSASGQTVGGIIVPGYTPFGSLNSGKAWIQTVSGDPTGAVQSFSFLVSEDAPTTVLAGYLGVYNTTAGHITSVLYASSGVAGNGTANQELDFTHVNTVIPHLAGDEELALFISDTIYTPGSTTPGGLLDNGDNNNGAVERYPYNGSYSNIGSSYYVPGDSIFSSGFYSSYFQPMDFVATIAAVPETSNWALPLVALIGLGGLRLFRRQRQV